MFILTQLMIPVFIGIIFYVFFKKFFSLKEILIFNLSVFALIVISYYVGAYSRSIDTEYWTEQIVRVEYYEPYETYVHATCTRSVPCGTDSKGNTTYCTEAYDCSYCNDVSASYYAVTQIGKKYPISSYNYERLVKKFKTTSYFVELNRNIDYHSGCGKDGDAYFCDWNGQWVTAESYSTDHTYTNKVQFSNSVFNYRTLDKKELLLVYDYPQIDGNGCQNHIIGTWYNINDKILSSQYLNYWNGKYGPSRQVKLFVFLYKNKSEDLGQLQDEFFKNGNKNEYILLLDYDSTRKEIQWFKILTWCEVANVKTEVSAYIYDNRKASLTDITKKTCSVLEKDWRRKSFEDFDYLMIEPSTTAWVITLILNLLLCTGLGVFFYNNEI